MRTLFLDFASGKQLIALIEGEKTVASKLINGKNESALIPTIQSLLASTRNEERGTSNNGMPTINRIAATTGPGGFMSLRVGISLANALSDGLKIPLAGIHLSDLWKARLAPPSSPSPFSRGEKGKTSSPSPFSRGPSSPSPFSRGEKGEPKQMGDEKTATNPMILKLARNLRKQSTEAEKILWRVLRNSQLGFKFRRQHPIQHRILDFYCHELRLGIEIDGSVHDDPDQAVYDRYRTEALTDLGIHIIRFRNEEVLQNLPKVLTRIQGLLRPPLPSGEGSGVRVGPPLPSGEGSGVRVGPPLPAGEGSGLPAVAPAGAKVGVRVAWLHSTKRESLFIRGFGDLAKEWPEPVLMPVEDVRRSLSPLGGEGQGVGVVGELIESQQAVLPLLKPLTDIRPLEEVLPTILAALVYKQKPLLPWYGRGA